MACLDDHALLPKYFPVSERNKRQVVFYQLPVRRIIIFLVMLIDAEKSWLLSCGSACLLFKIYVLVPLFYIRFAGRVFLLFFQLLYKLFRLLMLAD